MGNHSEGLSSEKGQLRLIKKRVVHTDLGSFDPFAGIAVLLLNDIGSDGRSAIVGGLLPLEVHVVLAPVLALWLAWWVGLPYKINNGLVSHILLC